MPPPYKMEFVHGHCCYGTERNVISDLGSVVEFQSTQTNGICGQGCLFRTEGYFVVDAFKLTGFGTKNEVAFCDCECTPQGILRELCYVHRGLPLQIITDVGPADLKLYVRAAEMEPLRHWFISFCQEKAMGVRGYTLPAPAPRHETMQRENA